MWRFQVAWAFIVGFVVLGAIGIAYKFWYITVPVGIAVFVFAIWLPRRKRAQQTADSTERAAKIAAAQQALHDARIELATALVRDDPAITPARLSLRTELPLWETTSLIQNVKAQPLTEP